jgi:hypothetical protein
MYLAVSLLRGLIGGFDSRWPLDGPEQPVAAFVGLTLSGALGGWLMNRTRRRLIAFGVGILVVQPMIAALVLSQPRSHAMPVSDLVALWCVMSATLGVFTGTMLRRDWMSMQSRRPEPNAM